MEYFERQFLLTDITGCSRCRNRPCKLKEYVVKILRRRENFKANSFTAAMNAQMRRIDLICKLLGPLFIALIDGISTETAVIVNFGMNVSSVVVEYYSIAKVRDTLSLYSQLLRSAFLIVYLRCTMKCLSCREQRNLLSESE